jgi:membrane-bound ClpP family serine protease
MGFWQDLSLLVLNIGWFSALLLIVGLGLLIFEIFTPGFHLPGITGIVLIILGIAFTARSLTEAVLLIAIIVLILSAAFVLALRSASKGRLYRSPLILKDAQKNTNGYLSMSDMKYLVGRRGVAGTLLRPAGTGDFDGVRLDVVTDSEYLQKGTLIEIIDVQGRRIVVRAISQQ